MADNGLDIGGKGIHLQASGPMAILAIVFLLVGGVAVYVVRDGFKEVKGLLQKSTADHDLLACVVSLTPEERTLARQRPDRDSFEALCPWMRSR